ncbi:flagellar motor protein MotB [Spirilliplanes yamanashiensis]|uniref:Flagellar basal body stator protein MotB n=1 Tax=Spirilliplanes yamanashiensis TaxID=42233 RepID=A0A8J3Y583_9ACTN|nr:flagellar motor protein MotB [Spirilliplanes yamanashiensis]MDP9814388.1 chemotaxis protein MotB [Spirilliplanes yamanashiensis]GIJ02041.1 flagellar basal body stator protein MotB [Spirilliplanes yamanashiensis]
MSAAKSGSPRKRKGGHEEHEEHVNHERWLVSYADMLTLLFVLFVVLFSMSNVDKQKFAELAAGLSAGFGAQSAAFAGQTSSLDGAGQSTNVVPIDPGTNPGLGGKGDAKTKEQKEQDEAVQRAVAAEKRAEASADAQAAVKEAENLKKIQEQITAALKKKGLQDNVKFTIDERGLVVTVVTNEIVFEGNRAELRQGGVAILNAIDATLKGLPNNLQIDGHTNQLNVKTTFYPSGWELSTARASSVVRHLAAHGISPLRMTASGYSDTRPLIDPKDPRSVTMNRRVDIVVLSSLPADQRVLLPAAAGTKNVTAAADTTTAHD